MKAQNDIYIDFDEYLAEEEKKLNIIYKELLKNNQDKNAIKKFDRIVKLKIDYRGILPCSKSFEGESLLTLSKTWMVLILIKITKGKTQQEQFLTLVNSSLTHELNEYEEYKEFYEEQCEVLFSDEEAINQINLNPQTPDKIDNGISHEELKNYYIYLLFRPKYFQKVNLNNISKFKKKEENDNKNKKRKSNNYKNKEYKTKSNKKNKSNNSSNIDIENKSDTEDIDEKGDRLDEKDMISKNRAKQPSNRVGAKTNKNSNSNRNKKNIEKEDLDYLKINDILNKKGKSEKKSENKKSGKKQKKTSSSKYDLEDKTSEDEDNDSLINDNKKAKKNQNKKKVSLNDKKNQKKNRKYEEIEESEEEGTTKKDKNKKEKQKNEKNNKNKKDKKDKKNKRSRVTAEKIFEMLGINRNLTEEEEEEDEEEEEKKVKKVKKEKSEKKEKKEKNEKNEKKSNTKDTNKRKSVSVPPKFKKEKIKNKDEESNNKNKKKDKDKEKQSNSGKKKEKTKKTKKSKKSKSDDDDDEFFSDEEDEEDLINTLSDLNIEESESYGSDLDKLDLKEKKKMEKEIQKALKGNSDLDLEELLEQSDLEGIPLSQIDSKDYFSDNIDEDED